MNKEINVVLILSGGSTKGSFQHGGLDALLTFPNVNIRGVFGISVGALNGSMLVQDGCRTDLMAATWSQINKPSDIISRFPLGYAQGFVRGGLMSNKPLVKIINRILDVDKIIASDVIFACGVMNMETGKMEYILNVPKNRDYLKDAIIHSSRFPIFMEPGFHNGEMMLDGGVGDIVPLNAALQYTNWNEIDYYITIMTSPLVPERWDSMVDTEAWYEKLLWGKKRRRFLHEVLLRFIEIQSHTIYLDDLHSSLENTGHDTSKFIKIYPKRRLETESTFGITPDSRRAMYKVGFDRSKFAFDCKFNQE